MKMIKMISNLVVRTRRCLVQLNDKFSKTSAVHVSVVVNGAPVVNVNENTNFLFVNLCHINDLSNEFINMFDMSGKNDQSF